MKILTYNLGMLFPFNDKNNQNKIDNIINIIFSYDIIVFQEILYKPSREYLIEKIKLKGFLFNHYFSHGPGFLFSKNYSGTGLLVVSKYPIIETIYKKYSINGKPHKILHSDYMIDKGVGLCYIQFNNIIINLYVTHLHANYVDKWSLLNHNDEYKHHRIAQLFELAQFIRITKNNNFNILCGDLNCDELTKYKNIYLPAISILKYISNMNDCMYEIYKNKLYKYPNKFSTFTNYNNNSYPPQRLDYIFYNSNTHKLLHSKLINFNNLSDHIGVESIFDTIQEYNILPIKKEKQDNNVIITYIYDNFNSAINENKINITNNKYKTFYLFLLLSIMTFIPFYNIYLFIFYKIMFIFNIINIFISFNLQKILRSFIELKKEIKYLIN
jgi:endonuclease/exonuclease/phosphatase family metal-dependent hydrolase